MPTIVGGCYVNFEIAQPLGAIAHQEPVLWQKLKDEERFAQGYGDARLSSGTHKTGHALDIVTGVHHGHARLTNYEILALVEAFESNGFAIALRVKGQVLGKGLGGKPLVCDAEHLHAAYKWHSNSVRVWGATRRWSPSYIMKMLKRRTS